MEGDCLCVNCRLVWKELRSWRKESRVSVESVQIINISSIYLVSSSGCICCVCRKSRRIVDIKILAIVGEKGAPIAVPLICWNVNSSNVK